MNLSGSSTPQKPKEQNKKEFTVQLTRNKAAVQNYPFLLSNKNVDRSGGHDHVNARPAGTQEQRRDNYGYYILKRTNDTIDMRPYHGQTQEDGKEKFEYVASVFGDRMLLKVETTEPNKKKLLWDTLSIVERVEGLEELPASANYTQIGGTCAHHGPSDRGIEMRCQTPNNNHWATAAVNANIENIAAEYRRLFPGLPRLAINDMSLPYGGRFDIDGNWAGSHTYHRNGLDVDVRSTTMSGDLFQDVNENDEFDVGIDRLIVDRNGNGRFDAGSLSEFRLIARRNRVYFADLERVGRSDEHWHLYFWNVSR